MLLVCATRIAFGYALHPREVVSAEAFVLRASILAFTRPPENASAVVKWLGSFVNWVGLSRLNDAFSAPHRSLRSDRGLTIDHCRVRVRVQEPPWSSIANPNQETSGGLSPARSAGDSGRATAKGRWGPSECEDRRPQNTRSRQRNLFGPSAQREDQLQVASLLLRSISLVGEPSREAKASASHAGNLWLRLMTTSSSTFCRLSRPSRVMSSWLCSM